MRVCVCVRACVHACVLLRACVHAFVCVCVGICKGVCMGGGGMYAFDCEGSREYLGDGV